MSVSLTQPLSFMMRAQNKRPTAYLSGGMQFADRSGADWRVEMGTWLREVLGHRVIDPVKESKSLKARMISRGFVLRGRRRIGGGWNAFFRRIVDTDTRFVAHRSDYVVCLWNSSARKGAGTQGELTVARLKRIPVYLVSATPREQLPGWIQGCITRHFATLRELRIYLITRHYHPE